MGKQENQKAVVEFDRVTLRFEEHVVLREVSFRLERGETKVLLGVTGAGKSVLLKMTIGLLQPNAGRIFVLGDEITNRSEQKLFGIRQRIGMVFQEGALFDSLTIGENVGYVFERWPEVSPEEADRRVREVLCFVELEHTFDLFPSQLSGGMRRRVAIARAIVGQPEIMLYDSPTAGLDPITAQHIMALVLKQRDVSGVSSLLVTHRMQDAFRMARYYYDSGQQRVMPAGEDGEGRDTHTRFLVLRDGDVIFHGRLQELGAKQDPYLRKFLPRR